MFSTQFPQLIALYTHVYTLNNANDSHYFFVKKRNSFIVRTAT